MKKFLVLYESSVSAAEQMAKASPEQAKAAMEMWMAWAKQAGTAVVDLGAPLGHAMSVKGGSSNSRATGFSILQAESDSAARELLKGHPHFHAPGASIVVQEFLSMPGMPRK